MILRVSLKIATVLSFEIGRIPINYPIFIKIYDRKEAMQIIYNLTELRKIAR